MEPGAFYLFAADLILSSHVLFVVFVVFGLILVAAGRLRSWLWVRNPWFRLVHLAAIGIVVLQSWLGARCPLTMLETALRGRAGQVGYAGTFVSHWLEAILYYRAPPWVFTVGYTVFGLLVLAAWFWVRPRGFRRPG